MLTLERAIAIAAEAHRFHKDKGGNAYILHPLRVMLAQSDDEARMAAVLHDVLEDSHEWDVARLRDEGASEGLLAALHALSKLPNEEGSDEGYMRFIARAASNPIALRVKLADLRDNLDRSRVPDADATDERRWAKYERALAWLDARAAAHAKRPR